MEDLSENKFKEFAPTFTLKIKLRVTMKKILCTMVFVAISIAMNSCSADKTAVKESSTTASSDKLVTDYSYNDTELETMKAINKYRKSIGLNALEKINHISYKCQEHNKYMIANKVMNHDNFAKRSENIMRLLGAKSIAENVAYNYKTADAVLKSWLASPGHKKNIEGNYTHFGLAVTTDSKTGEKYYTNIFVRI